MAPYAGMVYFHLLLDGLSKAGARVCSLRFNHDVQLSIEGYESERVKVLSVWSEFKDEDFSRSGRCRAIHAAAACTSRWCINA